MSDVWSEYCAKCGCELEGDGRTLWMACFYEMNELKIPFDSKILYFMPPDSKVELTTPAGAITTTSGRTITISSAKVKTDVELTPMHFYTLRVCKNCRAEWMSAIQTWFNTQAGHTKPESQKGTGIFVRRNGTTVELSEEEWEIYKNKRSS